MKMAIHNDNIMNLDIDYIRKNPDKVDWLFYISAYQKLSEDFIREFKDRVDWLYISMNPKIKWSTVFSINIL